MFQVGFGNHSFSIFREDGAWQRCEVSYEVMSQIFGSDLVSSLSVVAAFEKNRDEIEGAALRKCLIFGWPGPNERLVLTVSDFVI
ncbi:MAG: DUF1488 family protein [Rhodocyclaceae bacterium]